MEGPRREIEEIHILPVTFIQSDSRNGSSRTNISGLGYSARTTRSASISMSIPDQENSIVGFSGPARLERTETKNEHLMRSGSLGMCSDPDCMKCPIFNDNDVKAELQKWHSRRTSDRHSRRTSHTLDDANKHRNMIGGDAKGWMKRMFSCMCYYIPGVMSPHAKVVKQWNQFFVISCLFAIFLDPLFFFLLGVNQDNKCIYLNMPMTNTMVVLRTLTDLVYLLHILLQFRLAYVAPESRVMGAGDLVDDPKLIAWNYVLGYLAIDLFIVLPLPQIIMLQVIPEFVGLSGANYAKNLLRAAILIQYIPRLYRFLPLVVGSSPSAFVFESAWANFVMNLLTMVLGSHVIGSCWYLFGLQRVNQCFRDACSDSKIENCMQFLDCGHGYDGEKYGNETAWEQWKNNLNTIGCFSKDGFEYGIYTQAVNLTTQDNMVTRYAYSMFWGFQQISTLAGNQVPSYFIWEVLFVMAIIALGLLLFALLFGNMQNFLQALGSRRLEMTLRRRDVELWMSHRRLPEGLRRQVRDSERFSWAATRGVNEEMLMENLPEDLQREIRRHLFKFLKKVQIFKVLENELILDAICERLRTKTYIKGSKILFPGGPVDKMVFIIRGYMESISEDQGVVPLKEEDVCGEELLTWCLEHSSVNKDGKLSRVPRHGLLSNRTVECLTNVEAFVLRSEDLEEVTSLFSRFLRSPRVRRAIRFTLPYWRERAARKIQVAWRYRKNRIIGATSSSPRFV